MHDRQVPLVASVLAGLLVVSLWSGSAAAAGPQGSTATRATITVGPAANGTTVRPRARDTLVVRLPGNPTTGYRWSASRVPAVLRLLASSYVPSPPKRLGQGGTFVFRFAVRRGSGTLGLAYRRPWEKNKPPLRAFSLTVRAR
jgi:inhibitor of cysteine peptidase